jgi:hypothetical protein
MQIRQLSCGVDFAASPMVGSSEPETAHRFGSGPSRRRRVRSDIACVRTASHPSVDGRDGVTIARQRGLKVVGTLAALDLAAAHGLVDLQTMFDRLRATTFRSPLRLMGSMLEQDVERGNVKETDNSGSPTNRIWVQ